MFLRGAPAGAGGGNLRSPQDTLTQMDAEPFSGMCQEARTDPDIQGRLQSTCCSAGLAKFQPPRPLFGIFAV